MITRITAKHPKDEVRKLLHFAARQVDGLNHSTVLVKVKNSKRGYYGRAFPYLCSAQDIPTGANCLVTIGLGSTYPVKTRKETYETWKVVLVAVAAHEFRHIRDWQQGIKATEKAANIEGRLALYEYRKEN